MSHYSKPKTEHEKRASHGGTPTGSARGLAAYRALLANKTDAVRRWGHWGTTAVAEEGRGARWASNGDGGAARHYGSCCGCVQRRREESDKEMKCEGWRADTGAWNGAPRPDVAWPVRPAATRGATRLQTSETRQFTVATDSARSAERYRPDSAIWWCSFS